MSQGKTSHLKPPDKAATLVVNTIIIFSKNVNENGAYFPGERNTFVLDTRPTWPP